MGDRSAAVGNGLTVEIRILDDLNAGASAHEKTDGGDGEKKHDFFHNEFPALKMFRFWCDYLTAFPETVAVFQ